MGINVPAERRKLVAQLRARARVSPPPKLQAYLGSPYPVLGLSTPEIQSIRRAFRKDHVDLTSADLNALARALWSGPTHEEKSLAIGLMCQYASILNRDSWVLADAWVDEALGWALSDSLASGPISAMLAKEPRRFSTVLRWTHAKHFWRRRASTYAMRNWVYAGDLDRPFQLLERLLYDEEFWVQRAVGTWLRECWKKDRQRTEVFLRNHVCGLPRVVITVATERASKAFREELRRNRSSSRDA